MNGATHKNYEFWQNFMTRMLSELLGANEPHFRLSLQQLEAANGHPSADIRLTNEIRQAVKPKFLSLGLDPNDTTASELYAALMERVKSDANRLDKALRTRAATFVSAEGNVVAGIVHAIEELSIPKSCFGLKTACLKNLLKKHPPKKAMKRLGYRSMESMLKHEPIACVLAAAWLIESDSWRRALSDQYKKLAAVDFETRKISLIMPESKRWAELSKSIVARKHHNVLAFKELGAIVLLPLPADHPPGASMATLVLCLVALNEIRASSLFLKLCQVRADFGHQVQAIALGEPSLKTKFLGRPLPWQLIQNYYGRFIHLFREELFEPHIQAEDFSWSSIEDALSSIEPSLEFWRHSGHLSWLHQHQPVSLNIVDAVLSYCNKLPFEQRLVHFCRESLWHELMLGYLRHDMVEQIVEHELQPELAQEALV